MYCKDWEGVLGIPRQPKRNQGHERFVPNQRTAPMISGRSGPHLRSTFSNTLQAHTSRRPVQRNKITGILFTLSQAEHSRHVIHACVLVYECNSFGECKLWNSILIIAHKNVAQRHIASRSLICLISICSSFWWEVSIYAALPEKHSRVTKYESPSPHVPQKKDNVISAVRAACIGQS